MITKNQVVEAQNEWGSGVVAIGALREERAKCEAFASDFLDKMYAFELGTVLFKPTKCAIEQFRATKDEASSCFIAGEGRACQEDGFAINLGPFRFENTGIIQKMNGPLPWAISTSQTSTETKRKWSSRLVTSLLMVL